ncbi:huazacin family RiPP peptide, partial [Bacillus cereus]|uniref:huazacin family RiPP peptide n=1 Tax=Bacillus cereus TaxID=1396 RepID=UPI002852C182
FHRYLKQRFIQNQIEGVVFMEPIQRDDYWGCALKCAGPCLGVCAIDTASPVMDAIGTASGYAGGHG